MNGYFYKYLCVSLLSLFVRWDDTMVLLYTKAPEVRYFQISPEPGNLIVEKLGGLPDFISAQGGGLGEATATDFSGLKRVLGKNAHLVVPNWKHIYKENWKAHYIATTGDTAIAPEEVDERWAKIRAYNDPNGLLLINSKWFDDQTSIYGNIGFDGRSIDDKISVAFQENARNTLKNEMLKYQGRSIFSFQDQKMGPLMAYLQTRLVLNPALLLRVHNGNTDKIHLGLYDDINIEALRPALYLIGGEHSDTADTMATSIKDAYMLEFVGQGFLDRIRTDGFLGWDIFQESFTHETKIKYDMGRVRVIPNGVSPTKFAENMPALISPYSPTSSNIIKKQKQNKKKLQKDLGLRVDDKAKLFFSTARLTEQKRPQAYAQAISRALAEDPKAQFVVIGDVAGHGEILHAKYELEQLAAMNPRVYFGSFKQNASIARQLFATGGISFGSSSYEPFGFTDVDNHVNAGLSLFTAVDGFKDKTIPLTLEKLKASSGLLSQFAKDDLNKINQAPQAIQELRDAGLFGNGVLFEHADSNGLYWGFTQIMQLHNYLQDHPQVHEGLARLIMLDARDRFSNERLVENKLALIAQVEKDFVDNGWWPTTADKAFNPYAPSRLAQKNN
jgi:glycosyltransferase involved in cell wall biosynthesis